MTIISVDIDTKATAFACSSQSQSVIVKPGVYLNSSGGIGLLSKYANDAVQNYGNITGTQGVTFSGSNDRMSNYSEATIYGQSYAIDVAGDGVGIINDGFIEGNIGIYAKGGGLSLNNSGTIETSDDGLSLFGTGERITNAGKIASGTIGVHMNAGSTATIVNSGLISGLQSALQGAGSGAETINNRGTLDGDIVLGNGLNRITNTGSILGDVTLGNGGSVFNGRNGTVSGTITGGTGADKLIAGNDGETLAGGKGHDSLTGGYGADTFVLSSLSSADTDTIHDFTVANDLIQLDQTVFTHLAAGTVPEFSIGSAAASPTDFLFYNATSGALFYDADGSGAAAPAVRLATLATGLKLTAGNFEIT